MTLYAPAYDHGARTMQTIEHAEELKPFGKHGKYSRYISGVGFIGTIYNSDTLFYSAETVSKYWQKLPILPSERWQG